MVVSSISHLSGINSIPHDLHPSFKCRLKNSTTRSQSMYKRISSTPGIGQFGKSPGGEWVILGKSPVNWVVCASM